MDQSLKAPQLHSLTPTVNESSKTRCVYTYIDFCFNYDKIILYFTYGIRCMLRSACSKWKQLKGGAPIDNQRVENPDNRFALLWIFV